MLLGLISLLLGQWARWISQICVNSSLFNSRFFVCSEEDYGVMKRMLSTEGSLFSNETDIPPKGINNAAYHGCGEVRDAFSEYIFQGLLLRASNLTYKISGS